jgi:hypothetical protein
MSVSRLAFFAAIVALAGASGAQARGIAVAMDDVTLVSFKKPISTVYIGNPSVAELTMIDSRHIFVLGKSFGTTNLIALGPDKSVISNEAITVLGKGAGVVTVNRGANTYSYTCTRARCETTPIPGDAKTFFDDAEGEVGAHQDASVKAAMPGLQTQH